MVKAFNPWSAFQFALILAFAGCMKPGEEATGVDPSPDSPNPTAGLGAKQGGARIALPEIDFAALAKTGTDSASPDTGIQGYFALTISGSDMPEMAFRFPLGRTAAKTFEIKGIPAGEKRVFSGRLFSRDMRQTHAGTTVVGIKAGVFSDVRLYLAKSSGSADVCVVIEGQKLPPCAQDTLPPPPPAASCWFVSSDSVTGTMSLYPQYVNGSMGVIVTRDGTRLPVTTWRRDPDSLTVIVARTDMLRKWMLSGPVTPGLWTASVTGGPMESPFPLYGKPLTCSDTTVVPPKDTIKAGAIPSAASSAGEVTLCFEMRFDYAGKCGLSGHAKMSFFGGRITRGNITVADRPSRFYQDTRGDYSQSPDRIRIETFMPVSSKAGVGVADTLILDGNISLDRTMAKGESLRLPLEKKGIWTMTSVPCGSWIAKYPDSTCFAPPVIPPPADSGRNLALGGRVTASAFWEDNVLVGPENVRDGSNWDTANAGNYWNLPNKTKGWWQVDLGKNHPLRTIRIFNTSNSYCNDRGTKDFRVEIRDSADAVVLTYKGTLPFIDYYGDASGKSPFTLSLAEAPRGRYVKVYVDSWYPTRTDRTWPYRTCDSSNPDNEGGGLNEVQVFAGP